MKEYVAEVDANALLLTTTARMRASEPLVGCTPVFLQIHYWPHIPVNAVAYSQAINQTLEIVCYNCLDQNDDSAKSSME